MKFAFVSTMIGYDWGGSEELWSRVALELHRGHYEVAVCVGDWKRLAPPLAGLQARGVEIRFRRPRSSNLTARAWRLISRSRSNLDREWLSKHRPELVVISQGGIEDGPELMNLCRDCGIPYVVILQCNSEAFWPHDNLAADMAIAYSKARKVFCVSQDNLEVLQYQIGRILPDAEIVWNPRNLASFQALEWPAQDREVSRLACVARLDASAKGQDILFRVLAGSKWRGRQVEVNLYGDGGGERVLRNMAEHLELKNVSFCGHVADVREIWRRNHILVLPSRFEGMPLALVEAMTCGRPAVVTDVGGNAEMCVDGLTGFVAAAPVVSLFDEALDRAWINRADWEKMGHAGHSRVKKLVPQDPVADLARLLLKCVAA